MGTGIGTRNYARPVQWGVHAALLPLAAAAIVGYGATVVWTLFLSFTSSKMFPTTAWVGWDQYRKLLASERWALALDNLAFYAVGCVVASTLLGLLLAILMDQKIRAESLLRSVFLYPYALSFVVTGLVWQWLFNPDMGLQAAVQRLGFAGFQLDWIVTQDKVMWCVVIAGVWQGSGLVMALMLAGLRGVDDEVWKAARLDGIPPWRTYASIVLPMMRGTVVTVLTLQVIGAIKVYDTVIAMTRGGPGLASEVPAKFILDNMGMRANLGLASAAAAVLLVTVVAVLVPLYFWNRQQAARRGGQA